MKRIFLMLLGAMMVCAIKAQVVEVGESALVYYSPKTAISLDFTYSVETQERGIFAEYAEDLLGAEGAVMETNSTYQLRDVRISTVTSTDYSRPHKVNADGGVPMLLSINEKGLLKGYNLPLTTPTGKDAVKTSSKSTSINKKSAYSIAPYPEEVLEAANPLAQAHAVAKQIFHLRETRMYLLSGEVEHAPADGKAMELVLDELAAQEKALTELFMGKKSKKTAHKRVVFPVTKNDQYLFFSEENGFTDAENIDADTVRVQMTLHPQQLKAAAEPKNTKKKKGETNEVSQIVYNLPGSGDVSVMYKGDVLGQRTVPVAQIGVDVPLPKDLFMGAELPVIMINEKTGNIVSISK